MGIARRPAGPRAGSSGAAQPKSISCNRACRVMTKLCGLISLLVIEANKSAFVVGWSFSEHAPMGETLGMAPSYCTDSLRDPPPQVILWQPIIHSRLQDVPEVSPFSKIHDEMKRIRCLECAEKMRGPCCSGYSSTKKDISFRLYEAMLLVQVGSR